MQLIYHQINVSKIRDEINLIRDLSLNSNNILIGLEVNLKEINGLLSFNIDPQHSWNCLDFNRRITCLEKMREVLPILRQFQNKQIHVFFLKTDLDSISAAAILDIYLNTDIVFNNGICDRIESIANYDRHGRENYNSKIKIPRGLFLFVSGWKNSLSEKVEITKKWILTETFDNIIKYNQIATNNFRKSICSSKTDIIIPKKLVLIRSTKRGACGLGYKLAPIVIAFNPSYRFGFGESRIYGKKWIIGQTSNRFINMKLLLKEFLKIEENWGGSTTIIGSPQDKPSKLSRDVVVETVKKILVS